MKIGLISDLHLEFRNKREIEAIASALVVLPVDVIFDAGDLHPDAEMRDLFAQASGKPYYHVMGNHDFYHSSISDFRRVEMIGGHKVAFCTLWTDFDNSDPVLMHNFIRCLNDASLIKGAEAGNVLEIHKSHRQFIRDEKPDIVVTHHAPSYQSVVGKFVGNWTNGYFVNRMDEFIMENQNIKYWLHGHTHTPVRYKIGNTEVVSNQLGYPGENYQSVTQYPLVVIET